MRTHSSSLAPMGWSGERGFTLIELLVVMVIIAILMAVAVPTFLAQKSSARKTQLLGNIHMMKGAIEACAANNTDGTYTGCSEHRDLWQYEASLRHLPMCCPAGSSRTPGEFDLNGIGAENQILWVPRDDIPPIGYEIDTWMQDGDKKIWFQLAHWPDGTVTKECGESPTGRPTSFDKLPSSGVAGSRVCTTGRW